MDFDIIFKGIEGLIIVLMCTALLIILGRISQRVKKMEEIIEKHKKRALLLSPEEYEMLERLLKE